MGVQTNEPFRGQFTFKPPTMMWQDYNVMCGRIISCQPNMGGGEKEKLLYNEHMDPHVDGRTWLTLEDEFP